MSITCISLAIVGGRTIRNYQAFKSAVDQWIYDHREEVTVTTIVSGGAHGVDTLAAHYATENGLKLVTFLPEYDKYPGRYAPLVRNKQIVVYSDYILAFPGNKSRGTYHTIKYAKETMNPEKVFVSEIFINK